MKHIVKLTLPDGDKIALSADEIISVKEVSSSFVYDNGVPHKARVIVELKDVGWYTSQSLDEVCKLIEEALKDT